jgi:hypothetical protein
MYSYFSDLHVQLLAQGLLEPGEQLVGKMVTEYSPWWGLGLIRKTYLSLATHQRLIMIEHRMAWLHQSLKMHAVESLPWSNVQETKMTGLFSKKIVVKAQTQRGPINLAMKVPNQLFGLLAPMQNNMVGAKAVVGTFQQVRQMGAPQQHPSLPPYAPQINSQGYTSVAPPAPQFAQQAGPALYAPPVPPNGPYSRS